MPIASFKLLSMRGKTKIPHMSWMAFFISFVIWFNHAPLMVLIQWELGISDGSVEIVLLLNVALTIPARVIIGLAVDRFGARISYSVLLAVCGVPCFMFALAENFAELAWARFLLGFIGAGFVAGIVGAYGNAGAILFLILLTFLSPGDFFLLLGGCSLVLVTLAHYLEEPRGFISEIMPDGSIVKIELE